MVPDFSEQRQQQEEASPASSLNSSYSNGIEPLPIISEGSSDLPSKAPTGGSDQSQLSSKTLQKPRNERRGLLAQVTLIPEFYDARDYPMTLKSVLVFVIGLAAMIGPMGTTIVFPAIDSMIEDFGTTTMMVNVSVGIYLLALGVFPLWWSSFSESLGRRTVYITSFTMYIGFAIGAALSPSINALIVFRVLTGACSASVQAVGAGTVSDLFPPEVRGRAMGYFYLGTLASPLVSPIIGSLLLIRWDWRSTQWFTMALAALIDLCIILLLPETLREQNSKAAIAKILQERRLNKEVDNNDEEQKINSHEEESVIDRVCTRISMRTEQTVNPEIFSRVEGVDKERLMEVEQADEKRLEIEIKKSLKEVSKCKWSLFRRRFYEFVLRPLKAVYFLQYPPVALSISFSALTFSILYLMNMTLQYEFSRAPYNWKPLFVGFAYIPNSVSYIIASVYGGRWTDKLFQDYVKKHGFSSAESRISYNILSAVVCYPIALLIIGWCFQYHTFWVTPLIGSTIFGYATMMTIGPTMTYLVDSLPGRGATGIAVNNLCRQVGATAAVFLVDPMIKGMGTGPMCSMCAGLVILWSVVLLIIKKRGKYWRENYDLQALYDKLE